MPKDTSDASSHSGATGATVIGVVLLLLFGPLVIVLAELGCSGTNHFENALRTMGVYGFYEWLYKSLGIIDFINRSVNP